MNGVTGSPASKDSKQPKMFRLMDPSDPEAIGKALLEMADEQEDEKEKE